MKKNVHGMLNEIMDYNPLRQVLRIIYMYGAYSDSDILKKNVLGIKERTYKDMVKRLDNYFNAGEYSDTEHFSYNVIPNRKTDKRSRIIRRDPFKDNFEFLASTYHQHTISIADLQFYFYFLLCLDFVGEDDAVAFDNLRGLVDDSILDEAEENICKLDAQAPFSSLTLYITMSEFYFAFKRIVYNINGLTLDNDEDLFPVSKERVNSRLKELALLGMLEKTNETEYKLIPSFIPKLTCLDNNKDGQTNLIDFKQLISFFINTTPLTVPGVFVSEKISQTIKANSYYNKFEKNPLRIKSDDPLFLLESSRFQNIIDDEITLTIINAIDSMSPIKYEYQTATFDEKKTCNIVPVVIIDDTLYGRHYVFGYSLSSNNNIRYKEPILQRLDRIISVKVQSNITLEIPYEELRKLFDNWISGAHNTSGGDIDTKTVIINFAFDNSDYSRHLMKKLSKCQYKDHLESTGSNKYKLIINVKDTAELLPYINSFGIYARVSNESDPSFYETYCQYIKDNLSVYEPI